MPAQQSVGRNRPLAAVFGLVALTACGSGCVGAGSTVSQSPLPTSVSCTDASQLRQRALDDRLHVAELKSDQEKTSAGNRANFFASLAVIASLKCKVTVAAADEGLNKALDAARKAADTSSFYDRTKGWSDANFLASEAIALLVQQVPSQPSK